jgi:hypothetical protein
MYFLGYLVLSLTLNYLILEVVQDAGFGMAAPIWQETFVSLNLIFSPVFFAYLVARAWAYWKKYPVGKKYPVSFYSVLLVLNVVCLCLIKNRF